MNKSKINTFISTAGEVFTGTRKELMNEYGIVHAKGFNRPGGAADAHGDRWLSEEKFNKQGGIRKRKLFLGPRFRKEVNPDTGYVKEYSESPSNLACNYLLYKSELKKGDSVIPVEILEDNIKQIETEYDVIDNRETPSDKQINLLNKALYKLKEQRDTLTVKKFFPVLYGVLTATEAAKIDALQAEMNEVSKELTVLRNKEATAIYKDRWAAQLQMIATLKPTI